MYFSIVFSLPYHWYKGKGVDFFYCDKPVPGWKHKNFSIQLSYWGFTHLFDIMIDLGLTKQSHQGPEFSISLFGLQLHLNLYDDRHWDKENDCFYNYDNH